MSIPLIRQAQRSCSHCKQTGHQEPNCPKAVVDATAYHRNILNIIAGESGREKQILTNYLQGMMNLHDLCILMRFLTSLRMHNRLGRLIKLLIEKIRLPKLNLVFAIKKTESRF